jgi:cobalt-zinc-cadmium resistance protein CzcA
MRSNFSIMFNKIILFSIHNKVIVGVMTLGIVVYGLFSFTQLPIDAVPDITNNQVQIFTLSPTLATQEVEQLVSAPIERSLASVPDVEEIRSISRFGLSVVTIVFKEKVDIYFARQLVRERLEEAKQNIPNGLGTPELSPVSTGLGEVYQYLIEADSAHRDQFDAMKLREIQDWIVARQIQGTSGVAEVNSFGGLSKQYEVAIDPQKLLSKGVTTSEVFEALEKNNENTGGGYIDKKPNAYFIRGLGLIKSLDEVGQIKVKNVSGVPIYIKDIASVQLGSGIRYGAMTADGNGEVVGGIVMMLKGYNSAQVVSDIKAKLPIIQKSLPEGVKVTAFLDRTNLVNRAMNTVKKNLLEGALIVIFVLIIFLGNLRAGLIVASVIPLSLLFAIILMNIFKVSGNLMSLGAIDFGLIVDGAVIIVEATMHYLGLKYVGQKLNQKQMNTAVFESASKIRSAAAFGEIIILIVYLPILTLVGIEGKMFGPMAQTVGFAIIGALILSLTYVPMMSALFLSKKIVDHATFSDKMMFKIQSYYLPIIKWALERKKTIVGASLVLFVGSVILFSNMGGEFIPTLEEGDFAFHSILPQGSSISESIENNSRVEKILMSFPEVKRVVAKSGAPDIPTDPMPPEATDMMIILKDKDEWITAHSKEELMDTMMQALKVIPGVFYEATQPIQMRFNELMTGVRQDVAVKIFGENLDSLLKYGEKVEAIVSSINGASEPQLERVNGLPQLVINYKRENIANYDLTIRDVNRIVRTAFAGEVAGQVFENERRFDLVVRMDKKLRTDISDLKKLLINLPNGAQVPLEQLASVDMELGPAQISREEAKRRIVVGFNVTGRDVQSVVQDLQKRIESEIKLPPGYYTTYGGQFQNLVQASNRLMITVPIALFLIFFLLFLTFRSSKEALLIYSAIPLSAIGGVLALWIRDMPFSISAGVGFIALFGVAVLNGIVLISTFNDLEKEGFALYERVIEGTKIRLRPVLMTAMVASLGFLPMALSNSAGAEVQKPLATVIIGGLITATLLTLLVLPALYIMFSVGLKKAKMTGKSAIVSSMLLCLVSNAYSQNASSISVDDAVTIALKQNNFAISANLNVDFNKKMELTSGEIGKTGLNLTTGQYNSFYNDQSITLSQSLPFPTVFKKQRLLLEQQTNIASASKLEVENSLRYEVRQCYSNIQYLKLLRDLLEVQDSVLSNLLKSAELRYKTGESTFLEGSTISAKLNHLRNEKMRNEIELNSLHLAFRTLLNSDDEFTTQAEPKEEFVLVFDSLSVKDNPQLKKLQEQIQYIQCMTAVEKSKLLPDITIGYFNQSLYGTQNYANTSDFATEKTRFQGVTFGLAIPIWSKPQMSRIKATEILTKSANAETLAISSSLNSEFTIALNEYKMNLESLSYYKSFGLETARVIFESAEKSYTAGEIGYFEYAAAVEQSLNIRRDYLLLIKKMTQTINNIQYLAGI